MANFFGGGGSGGGSGTVTSFSSGNLAPVFTTSLPNASTTPALSFTLSNAGAGTIFGNNTGVSAAPAYVSTPVFGVNATTAGTLGLANGAVGGNTVTFASGATSAYTLTTPASVFAQGDLLTFSNGTGQMASVADVATGQVLISGGVGAVPSYSANPTVTTITGSLISGTASPAGTGQIRLASGDALKFRNNANSADIALSKDASDRLVLSGFAANLAADGTSSAPSYSFTNATGTGIYNSSGALGISTSNAAGGWQFNSNGVDYSLLFQTSGGRLVWNGFTSSVLTGFTNGVRVGGQTAVASPVSQILQIGGDGTGTNITGGNGTIKGGIGTGNGAGHKVNIQRNLMGASGTTAQSQVDGFVVGESKTLSNTSATTTALANISVPSNSAGGCSGTITVVASDGTNFDAETQSFNVSFVNKAGTLTIGTPAITASTAASNSGSTTIGMTATAGTNSVNINVTPVFTTIVPTTVTAYITITNNGTGNVTIN